MTMKKIMKMMVIVCLLFVLSSIYDDCVSGFKRCNGHRMSRFVCFSFVRSFVTNQSIDSQYNPIVSTSITRYDATRCGKRSGQHDRSTRVVDGVHEHQRYRSTNATGHRIDHGDADAFKVRIGCGEIHGKVSTKSETAVGTTYAILGRINNSKCAHGVQHSFGFRFNRRVIVCFRFSNRLCL